jgi:hypothetical protein
MCLAGWKVCRAGARNYDTKAREATAMDKVAFFAPYPFQPGQKVRIEGGPRSGDWLVIGVTERKVTLRYPISGREFEWDRFCYLVEEQEAEWPARE